MISRTNIVLAVLLGCVALLAAVSRVNYSRPNVEVLADWSMKYTPASTTYEPSQVFFNRMTQQQPVQGTIARGEMPLYFAPLPPQADPREVAPKDAVPGRELVNPLSLPAQLEQAQQQVERDGTAIENARADVDSNEDRAETSDPETTGSGAEAVAPKTNREGKPTDVDKAKAAEEAAQRGFQASVDRGNDIFLAFCICCHGAAGMGDGMVAQRGYPPPPSFLVGTSNQWNDGQLFYILTHGRANMPTFAAELPRDSRWDVINYVRTLQNVGSEPAIDQQQGPLETSSEDSDLKAGASTPGTAEERGSAPAKEPTRPQNDEAKGVS